MASNTFDINIVV